MSDPIYGGDFGYFDASNDLVTNLYFQRSSIQPVYCEKTLLCSKSGVMPGRIDGYSKIEWPILLYEGATIIVHGWINGDVNDGVAPSRSSRKIVRIYYPYCWGGVRSLWDCKF